MPYREFLRHPLTIDTDWRLIASVEIMSIRGALLSRSLESKPRLTLLFSSAPLHLTLYNLPEEEAVGLETLAALQQANAQFEQWYQEWDTNFGKDGAAMVYVGQCVTF